MNSGVQLHIEGANVYNFFARCNRLNIKLYNIEKKEYNSCILEMSIVDYNRVKDYLRKYYNSAILKYTGRAKIKNLYTSHFGFAFGIIFILAVIVMSNMFVWNIKVYGLESTDFESVLECLSENNVSTGSWYNCDIDELELILLESVSTLADVSIEKRGTSIIVNVSEKLVYAVSESEAILAPYNGVVISVNLSAGTLAVSRGDFVQAGEVLVYPYIVNSSNEQVGVVPIAQIELEAQISVTVSEYYATHEMVYTGNTFTEKSYILGNIVLFSKNVDNQFEFFDKVVYNTYISQNLVLPIVQQSVVYREYELIECTRTYDELVELLIDECDNLNISPIAEIISEDLQIVDCGDYVFATKSVVANIIVNS